MKELSEKEQGFADAVEVMREYFGGSHYGDSSNMAMKASKHIPDYEQLSVEYRTGFVSGVYSTHVCG